MKVYLALVLRFKIASHSSEGSFASRSGCGSGSRPGWKSRVLMTENWKNLQLKNISFFISKIAIYFSLGLHRGRPNYRRSLQPSKENGQNCKT
jgi:hypothetical protein